MNRRPRYYEIVSKYDKKDPYNEKVKEEEKVELEKKDIPALLISSFLVIFLPIVLLLLLIVFGALAIMGLL